MPTHTEKIEHIRQAIETQERCRAVHMKSTLIKTEFVDEFLRRPIPFETNVETFELAGHVSAPLAYGWELMQKTREKPGQVVIQLHSQGIHSPKTAVDEWYQHFWAKRLS